MVPICMSVRKVDLAKAARATDIKQDQVRGHGVPIFHKGNETLAVSGRLPPELKVGGKHLCKVRSCNDLSTDLRNVDSFGECCSSTLCTSIVLPNTVASRLFGL